MTTCRFLLSQMKCCNRNCAWLNIHHIWGGHMWGISYTECSQISIALIQCIIIRIAVLVFMLHPKIAICWQEKHVFVSRTVIRKMTWQTSCITHVSVTFASSIVFLSTLKPTSGHEGHLNIKEHGLRCIRILSIPCAWPARLHVVRWCQMHST